MALKTCLMVYNKPFLNILKRYPIASGGLRLNSYLPKEYIEDPSDKYLNSQIQDGLKLLTRLDIDRVYRKRKLGNSKLQLPRVQFMSKEQLEDAQKAVVSRVKDLLQMPPVLQKYTDVETKLHRDDELRGLLQSRLVFTDITYGSNDTDRVIVVREADGILRHAEFELRNRMNQLYFPQNGRELRIPQMFRIGDGQQLLSNLLDRHEYEFILDRACAQFEPNDENYQRITSITYQHCDNNFKHDLLRSTRHFGPFVFFLIWFRCIDNLLLDLIRTEHISEAFTLIKMHNIIVHNNYETLVSSGYDDVRMVEEFIHRESSKRAGLELTLEAFKDLYERKNQLLN